MKGILGKKVGMTQVFTEEGKLIPVTVISVEPNVVTQIKTKENDGYEAIQLGFETIKEKSSNKPKIGHTKKANTEPKRFLREIRGVNVEDYKLGDTLTASIFEVGEVIDITGISKGKGFQGSIKRHNFSRGPMSHGSQYHRGVGSELTTVQNSVIVDVLENENVILVKGNVPGPKKGLVILKTAIKNQGKKLEMAGLVDYTKEVKNEEIVEEASTESQE